MAAVAVLSVLPALDARADSPSATDETVASFDGTPIAITVFRPAGADARHPVPVVLDSHGWGGSRRTSLSDPIVVAFLERGYAMVSFDQRGHGESGGQANVQDPKFEVRDTEKVIDRVATFDWVQHQSPTDPVLGAIGGSYGGGYQTMTALAEQAERPGGTRFDALAPQITWYDLPDSLAPSDVPRTEWLSVLYATGAKMLPPYIHEGFAEGVATGSLPPAIKDEFAKHSPRWFTDRGVRLSIPVLFRQGESDNLFDLNQGLANFDAMLTPGAKAASRLVGFNGGHALPSLVPPGRLENSIIRPASTGGAGPTDMFSTAGDACSGDGGILARTLEFFDAALKHHGHTTLPTRYALTTDDGGACVRLDALPPSRDLPVPATISTAAAGVPQFVPVAAGPLTVAGIPHLRALLTTFTPDTRVFLGLAVGTNAADARLVQDNVLPLRAVAAVAGAAVDAVLPGVAVRVPAGQTLFLVVSPVDDQFAAHGSRMPGAAQLDHAVLALPIVAG